MTPLVRAGSGGESSTHRAQPGSRRRSRAASPPCRAARTVGRHGLPGAGHHWQCQWCQSGTCQSGTCESAPHVAACRGVRRCRAASRRSATSRAPAGPQAPPGRPAAPRRRCNLAAEAAAAAARRRRRRAAAGRGSAWPVAYSKTTMMGVDGSFAVGRPLQRLSPMSHRMRRGPPRQPRHTSTRG